MWPNSSPQTTNRIENKDSGLKSGIVQGLIKGWKAFIWLLKIIIPISFVTALLVHFEIIYKLDFILTPIMNWLCLPASAAVAIIAGLFTGIYGTVAALSVMPFSMDHMILIAVFTLISHNLIQESLVQANSGLNFFYAAFFRLFMSVVVTFVCAKIMHTTAETGGVAAQEALFSIGVNHSMIEDPALFLPLGLPMFWLWIPRLVAAILIAWLYSVFVSAGRFYVKRTGHKKLCNH